MKKTLLAGTFLVVLMLLIVYSGKIAEFSWEGKMPGSSPAELWVRHVSGELTVEERLGKVVLKEVLEGNTSLIGIDYNGRNKWQENWDGKPEIYFDNHSWGYYDQSQGTITFFDYNGNLVRRVEPPPDYKYFWSGSKGETIFSCSVISGKDRLEGLYGEKGIVVNNRGEQIFEETFPGMGIMDIKFLSGTDNLIISLVEIFPYISAKVYFSTLEGEKLAEIRGDQFFFSPIILKDHQTVVLISDSHLYVYSFKGAPLFKREWEDSINASFSGPGGDSLIVVITPEQILKEKTNLVCLSLEGEVIWEKELPGAYRQGKSRQDGGILIETDLFLYLLQPDGNTLGYYSPEEGHEIYLLSTDTFLTFDRGKLTAYRWSLK
ncbi:hypothetical protein [Candidatus Contubernalis alkaliaceticus]|uniref:hypothetical protein n=1 Tax=Candidatus Contubernalis alkaliaceticus TaxID=338645 RepID=UPI001F4C32D1|nr:hypothetical protein [Candidatus Contubernalis alkalaceticus]UNC93719.1 hypothetical protein HUE98_17510 [Candidatus Contubernalis alkalaceticus]